MRTRTDTDSLAHCPRFVRRCTRSGLGFVHVASSYSSLFAPRVFCVAICSASAHPGACAPPSFVCRSLMCGERAGPARGRVRQAVLVRRSAAGERVSCADGHGVRLTYLGRSTFAPYLVRERVGIARWTRRSRRRCALDVAAAADDLSLSHLQTGSNSLLARHTSPAPR